MAVGGLFLVSGFEKLLHHYQNFLYVVQSYEFLPAVLEKVAALVMPWVEVVIGIFTLVGLWLPVALRGVLLLTGSFILVVGQALWRHLPIDECGCFGNLISFPPRVIIFLDTTLFILTVLMLYRLKLTSRCSLDERYTA